MTIAEQNRRLRRRLPLVLLLNIVCAWPVFCQDGPSISVIDFVKIKDGRTAEAMFFYENNWKVYRDRALKEGFIRSYRLLKTEPEAGADFDLLLITEFANAEQLKLSEERFNRIIKEINPGGPKLLNNLPQAEFRQNLYSKTAETIFFAAQK